MSKIITIALCFLLLACSARAQTATPISSLPAIGTVGNGDFLPILQGGITYKTTAAKLSNQTFGYPFTATDSINAQTLKNRFGQYITQFDFGAVCDGTTDDTAAFNAMFADAGAPYPRNIILAKGFGASCIFSDTLTVATSNRVIDFNNVKLVWTSGIAQKPAIAITGDNIVANYAWMQNPNLLGMQTGERNYAFKVTGNNFKIANSYMDKFQNCVWADYSATVTDVTAVTNTCHDLIGAGDGQSSSSGYGEDRGDGFYAGISNATFANNHTNCMAGHDCRIGVHGENIHPELYDQINVVLLGNTVTGKYRRGAVCENPKSCDISDNTGQDMTWWDVACIGTQGACGGSGNHFTYNRASTDNAGSAWSPIRAPLMIYGKTENVSFDRSNQFNLTGYADAGAVIQGLNTGDSRAHTINLAPQITTNDNGGYCIRAEYADGVTLDPVCTGFKDYGVKSFDVTGKVYRGYFNSVNKLNTKLILTAITGTFTVGNTITGGTSGAVGTLIYVDATNKLLTISQTYAQSATAFQVAETVTNAGSVGSGAVARLNTYGQCVNDDNNSVGGDYDGAYCENALTGKSIVNKTYVHSNGDTFKNVVTAYEGFGDTNSIFGIGSTFNTVTTKYSNTNAASNFTSDTIARNYNITDPNSVNVGTSSLAALTATGRANAAFGISALTSCTTCQQNVAMGNGSLQATTTGGSNTGVGHQALTANTTGSGNVAIGFQSAVGLTTGSQNTAIGTFSFGAAGSAISSTNNTAIGYGAMSTATGAVSENTGVGKSALGAITTGTQNTVVGSTAGNTITTGGNNIAIGYNAQVASATGSNQLNLGGTLFAAGLGTATPQTAIGQSITSFTSGISFDLGSNLDSMRLPKGTTAQRPTGAQAMMRYNTTTGTGVVEYHDGSAWQTVSASVSGTFTPTVIGSSTAGTTTYTTQIGKYTKIGNLVFVSITVTWIGMTGTGDLQIGGLPFAPSTTYQSVLGTFYSNLVVGAGKTFSAETSTSSSILILSSNDPAGGATANTPVDNAATIIVSGTYITD